MALELIKLVKGSSAVAQVGSFGFFKLSADTGGGGGSDIVFDRVFGNNTPDVISAVSAVISANNMTSAQVEEQFGWNLGDKILYQLTTGENVEMRIIGFNHDTLSDGSGKAGITLEMTHCLVTGYPMNSTDTNAGGWSECLLRTTTLPTIKSTLPTEWQNIIKKVDKKSASGGSTNYSEVVTTSDDLFLLSQIELSSKSTDVQGYSQEGSMYEALVSITSRVKKYDKNGDGVATDGPTNWWIRSCYSKNTTSFRAFSSTGSSNSYSANNAYRISFAFCV